jgi:hypothetical protein
MKGNIMVLNYYQDPGHGWIKVPRQLLLDFGIHKQVSKYSYESHDGMSVYLEEDSDAPLLLHKLDEKELHYKLKIFHTNKQSKIRSYKEYTVY